MSNRRFVAHGEPRPLLPRAPQTKRGACRFCDCGFEFVVRLIFIKDRAHFRAAFCAIQILFPFSC